MRKARRVPGEGMWRDGEFKWNNYIEFISTGQWRCSLGSCSFNFPWYLPACPPSIGLEINLFFNQLVRALGVVSHRCLHPLSFERPITNFSSKSLLHEMRAIIIGITRKDWKMVLIISYPMPGLSGPGSPSSSHPSALAAREGQVLLKRRESRVMTELNRRRRVV